MIDSCLSRSELTASPDVGSVRYARWRRDLSPCSSCAGACAAAIEMRYRRGALRRRRNLVMRL